MQMHQEDSGLKKNGCLMPPTAAVSPPLTSIASSSIGVHLRVTGHCSQGGRKYMEDFFSVAYHESKNTKDLEYAFVGIYDGHGGSEAAAFAKEHLMMEIINQKLFWSDSDEDVLSAIREGYKATHYAMWREQENWPKTPTGLPSTAGTTATVAFIRHEKIYIGHVGDSGIVLGYQNSNESFWRAKQLTLDHKPENALEKMRIMNSGGKVVAKSGVPRVVWNRPSIGHKGPVRRSTPFDEIPFLAVARSLGDLWSYNSELNEFIVSPDPDVKVIKVNTESFRCLVFGTDGLWNVVTPEQAVETVREKEITNKNIRNVPVDGTTRYNPSRSLVENALKKWSSKKMRADNTSVVTVIFYPTENSSTKTNSPYNLTSSHGLQYMQMNIEGNPSEDHLQNSFQPNADNNMEQQLLDTDIHDQIHRHSDNETIATNTIIHKQQHSSSQNRYNQIFFGFENIASCNNYHQINSGDNEYLYYDDQVSNNFINSFVESYNSLLTTNKERQNTNRFSANSVTISGESNEIDPCKYDSYNSLFHTGLAGHDRVHHHLPNNDFQLEQQMYQEQCMSAEEGYCLTKLETRVEQQLRGTINKQTTANSFEIFLGGRTDELAEESYNQYNYGSNNFPKVFNCSDTLTSHLLSSNKDDTRCYKPTGSEKSPYLWPDNVIKTTSLYFGRLNDIDLEKRSSIDKFFSANRMNKTEIEKLISDGIENQNADETIQIHGISSSLVEMTTPSSDPLSYCKTHIAKTTSDQIPAISHKNSVGSTHSIKGSLSKLALYANVPNENHQTPVRSPMHQYPKTFEKRMLRSMTDYSKRTLRSRNNLFKDLKSKNTQSTNSRKLNGVHNKCMKSTSPSNVENSSSVISKKCLTPRSRDIKTKSAIFSEPDVMSVPQNSNEMHQRKSKLRSFCNTVASPNQSLTATNRNDCNSSTKLHRKYIGLRSRLSTISHQQPSISFAKRYSIKNSGWGSGKTPMQTRNHVQKRMSR